MKKLKTFEQYNSTEILNEGVITDIVNKYSGKLKEVFKSVLAKFSPEQKEKLRAEAAPFKGMSYDQIKQSLASRSTANEDTGNKIMNYTGLAIFTTFATSLATLFADSKWRFLHQIFNLHSSSNGMQNDTTYFLAAAGISFFAFILWFYLKLDSYEDSYADSTRPSGTSSAERHSSAYIANQMKNRR